NLVNFISLRHNTFGDEKDLNDAVRMGDEVLKHPAAQSSDKARVYNALRRVFTRRYDATGDKDLLDVAVERGEQSISVLPDDDGMKKYYICELANLYLVHYQRTGDFADTEKASRILNHGLRITSPHDDSRSMMSYGMGQCHYVKYTSARD